MLFQILFGVLFVCVITLGIQVVLLRGRIQALMRGKKGADLEQVIVDTRKHIDTLHEYMTEMAQDIEHHDKRLAKSIRGVHTIRFNPFQDSGGNQSFATCLIDESGDGVILSSLFARERMSVFAKPIAKNTSTFELTTEEKKALEGALRQIKN